MLEASLIIEGARVTSEAGGVFERIDPVTGRILTRSAAAEPRDAERAAAAAAGAFPRWSSTPGAERSEVLERAAVAIARADAELVECAAEELGATREWIQFNVNLAARTLAQAATLPALMKDESFHSDGARSILRRQPAGVVVGFAPWNAPVTLAVRAVAAPLACGNTVVLKGSELCPRTHELVVEILNSVGLPDGVLNYVVSASGRAEEIAGTLIAHSAVRRVNFTGSTRVGCVIARLAAENLKPCLLELSGKAPLIVLDDADLDAAARAAAFGAYFNRGQICRSTERIIVLDTVADAFIERLRSLAEAAGRGGTLGPGPLVGTDAAFRIKGLVDEAVADGADLVAGGEIKGLSIAPVVLDRVHSMMRIYHEECVGPVASVVRVVDADEAVSIANRHELWACCSRVRLRRGARSRDCRASGDGDLPAERSDGLRRSRHALRRHEGQRLRQLGRDRSHSRVHRPSVDRDTRDGGATPRRTREGGRPMKRRTSLKLATALVVLAGGAWAQADPIVIGAVAPKTGPLAGGAAVSHWPNIQLWAHQINEGGGLDVGGEMRPVEIIEYDDQTNPGETIKAVQRLATQDEVDFILAPYGTGLNIAAAPIFDRYGYPQITSTAITDQVAELSAQFPNMFFTLGGATGLAEGVVKVLSAMRDAGEIGNTVAMVNVADAFGIELADAARPAFEEAGFELVYDSSYPLGTQDLSPVVKGAAAEEPDAFVAFSYPGDTFGITEQAQIEGLPVKAFYTAVGASFPAYHERFGSAAENIIGAGGVDASSQAYQDYAAAHQEVTGQHPDYWASAMMYSSLQILQQAIEGADTLDREAVSQYIKDNSFETVIGTIEFDEQNNNPAYWTVGQWQDGVFEGVASTGREGAEPVRVKSGW
jgi:branched-chain amino acid transport system substrate-binding protein